MMLFARAKEKPGPWSRKYVAVMNHWLDTLHTSSSHKFPVNVNKPEPLLTPSIITYCLTVIPEDQGTKHTIKRSICAL